MSSQPTPPPDTAPDGLREAVLHYTDAGQKEIDAIMRFIAAQQASLIRSLAKLIWEDEQKCLAAISGDPTNAHLNGRLVGLQRARDILEAALTPPAGEEG